MKTNHNQDACYTSAQLAKMLLPAGSEYTLDHVEGALEEITIISLARNYSLVIDRAEVVHEVKEMGTMMEGIVAQLEAITFTCQWVLPKFDRNIAGFRLV
ncbi:hypothetical protein [Massilia sp. TSP1-1-2]|uniref:hypothetical protein n=1 Tax=Massilia sp. TSP1-1-2 TaxID=2804649 RepID=UPI003CF92CCC